LAAVGFSFLADLLGKQLRTRSLVVEGLIAVLLAAALIGATQFGTGKTHVLRWANSYYGLNARPGGTLVTENEYELIKRLPGIVPADDVVAVNPWNGGSMAYALAGVHTNHTHVLYSATKNDKMINARLNAAATSPAVCQALDAGGIDWVLDFGNTQFLNAVNKAYPGFWHLDVAEGFEPVDSEGGAVLYRITACERTP
ncbi:MAG: hypothetical protein Q4G46_15580, partial [Propionibacteriaceae bacterium]|nr:hypothetical protein [Propionibacteriaceae bacterium]